MFILQQMRERKSSFFVVEETKIAGENYLLVTDSEEDEADAYIFREVSENENDSFYEMVEDERKNKCTFKGFCGIIR